MKKVVEVLRRPAQIPVPDPTANINPLISTYANTLVSMEVVMLLGSLNARKPAAFVETMKRLHVNTMLELMTVSVQTLALASLLRALRN